jgi:dTDP-4-dehydrorhamnose reductase
MVIGRSVEDIKSWVWKLSLNRLRRTMKLALIGGYGQVGQEFQKYISPENLVIFSHEQIEVGDLESVNSALARIDCDVVINLAAFHNTNQCEIEKEKAFLVNSIGAYNVAKISQEMNIKVVYSSTDYVFGLDPKRDKPYVETDVIAPLNIYGASKSAGEMMVRAMNKDHLIIRTSSLYGAVTSKKGWTFPEMIYNKARKGEPLKVVDDQIMSPTYTNELVKTLIEFLRKDASGTIHVAGGGQCSWYEFACETLRLLNIDHEIESVSSSFFPSKAERPKYSVLSSIFFEDFKVDPMSNWKEALKQYLIEKGEL